MISDAQVEAALAAWRESALMADDLQASMRAALVAAQAVAPEGDGETFADGWYAATKLYERCCKRGECPFDPVVPDKEPEGPPFDDGDNPAVRLMKMVGRPPVISEEEERKALLFRLRHRSPAPPVPVEDVAEGNEGENDA